MVRAGFFADTVNSPIVSADRNAPGSCSVRTQTTNIEAPQVDDVILVAKDLQPAAFIIVAVAIVAIASNMFMPIVGPWASLIAVAGVTVYVGNRVSAVDSRPAWLLPLAAAGGLMAAAAGYRLWKAIRATSNSDRTIGYVFPTAMAIGALWLAIALIHVEASEVVATVTK